MKKRIIALMLISMLCISCATIAQASWHSICGATVSDDYAYCPYCGEVQYHTQTCWNCGSVYENTSYAYCPDCGYPYGDYASYQDDSYTNDYSQSTSYSSVMGYTIDKLSTRTGPSTKYTELGTYSLKNTYVEIISKSTDSGGVVWLQCDIEYHGERRRIYTGLKRFDQSTFNISQVRTEEYLGSGKINSRSATFRMGPGYDYSVSKESNQLNNVRIVSVEGNWVQVESTGLSKNWRVWVESDYVDFN